MQDQHPPAGAGTDDTFIQGQVRSQPFAACFGGHGQHQTIFNPTLTGVAATILGKLTPALRVLGPALLVLDSIKLVGQAWELGNAKLAEYVALSEKAAASGVSTDFFQRLGKAAEAAVTPVDTLTAAMKKLNDAAAPQLGGNAAEN